MLVIVGFCFVIVTAGYQISFCDFAVQPNNLDKEKDPMAGIMDLMKNMYEDGDEEMKRTIAKAWSDARSGKTLTVTGIQIEPPWKGRFNCIIYVSRVFLGSFLSACWFILHGRVLNI
ncbi:calcyclin-binding protein [Cinnamomum micranthum f. kanehirae]|uniref:Calcyclin-binding protein n=1 Tax=Cinnamomum micranthum f. kanehirae TaxID=337451 RepID=A0A443Q343_9MAGN|nr:calcyclin-binding protein [Cinnamomum micranthum f. kanehirae]